ncbi:MAG: hypothetical protein HYU51_14795 [Candidatus Rokubacteria bacterium]|nr:hypothetical protein [Candidatus Rokubacteria bacterium]
MRSAPRALPAGGAARRADIVCALALALLPFAVLGRALLPGNVLAPVDILTSHPPFAAPGAAAPANPLLFDVTFVFHPWQAYAAGEIAAGRFPLWNAHAFAGAPFFGNAQAALLFPLTWLGWVLPLPLALGLGTIARVSLAGLAAYWFLRALRASSGSALMGALVYQGSAVLVVWLQWSYASAIAVLPLVFGAVERLRQRPGPRPIAVLALAVALEALAGYPRLATLGVAAAALWGVTRGPATGRWPVFLGRLGGGFVLGGALATVQILPFVEYVQESSILFYRGQWTPIVIPPGRTAIALLMPWYYGGPGAPDYWGYSNFNETATSVGLVPWLLLPVAAIAGWRRNGTPFWLAVAVMALAGVYRLPFVGETLAGVPPLTWIRSQRVLPLLGLALGVLAATAIDALREAAPPARARCRVAVLVAGLVLVWLALASIADDAAWLARHPLSVPIVWQYAAFAALVSAAVWLLLRGAAGDVVAAARRGVGEVARGEGRGRHIAGLAIVQVASTLPMLVAHPTVSDVRWLYPLTPALRHLVEASARDPGRVDLGAVKNLGALYGLREVAGYDALTPRLIERVASPAADLGLFGNSALSVTTGAGSPVFDLLAIRRVLVPAGAPPPAPHFALEHDGPDARVYRNERALPRAFFVARARGCVADALALRLMHEGRVDFRSEVLLAACDAPETDGGRPSVVAPHARVSGAARIVEDEPERVAVQVEAPVAGWLVLADTWFPGWRVTLDGAEARPWRANHAFRAVRVPAGQHVVRFTYAPASVRLGLGATVAALGVTLVCLVLGSSQRTGQRWQRHRRVAVAAALVVSAGAPALAIAVSGPLGWWMPGAGGAAGTGTVPDPLPASPFALQLSPPTLTVGDRPSLRLESDAARRRPGGEGRERSRGSGSGDDGLVDVYVARLPGGPPGVRFLVADGEWAGAPAPLARSVSAESVRVATAWREDARPGWTTFIVVAVRAGLNPARRENWAYEPIVAIVRSRAAPGPATFTVLVPAAALALAATGLVVAAAGLRSASRGSGSARAPRSAG